MGNFTLSPTVFQCLSSKKRRNSHASSSSSVSSGYGQTSSSCTSVTSSNCSLSSTASTSSQHKLVSKKEEKSKSSSKVKKSSPFCGPTAFSRAKNEGYSPDDLASLQAFRFAGRWKLKLNGFERSWDLERKTSDIMQLKYVSDKLVECT